MSPEKGDLMQKALLRLAESASLPGVLFAIIFWTPFNLFQDLQYILCAFIIIFLIGAKDDILPIDPTKKLIGEIAAALILIIKSNVKITSFYTLFGINTLPDWFAIIFTCFVILVIINAFNLIDGINGLTASIGALISICFGTWFLLVDRIELAIVGFALAGALIAFLKYNVTPAKIFMGDTGSLLTGLICSILTIKFMEVNSELSTDNIFRFEAFPAVAVGILIIPLFDTLRVFITRLIRNRSPFKPDRNHIHHLLIDYGYSHMSATAVLLFVNVFFIVLVFYLQDIGTFELLLLEIVLALLLTTWLYLAVRKKRARQKELLHQNSDIES